jgi:hypothetical protein
MARFRSIFCPTINRNKHQIFLLIVILLILGLLVTLSVVASRPESQKTFYSDSLFSSALIEQIRDNFGRTPIFGLSSDTSYYLGAFALFGSLARLSPVDPYTFLCVAIIPLLIIMSFVSLITLLRQVLPHPPREYLFYISLLVLFADGNFLLQPNIDDRLMALFPVISLTQFLGIIILFDLISSYLHTGSKHLPHRFMVLLPGCIALVLTKPSLLFVFGIFVVSQISFFNRQTVLIPLYILFYLISVVFTLSFDFFIDFQPVLPNLFSTESLNLVMILAFLTSKRIRSFGSIQVSPILKLFILVQIWFFSFNFYGAERWFLDPLRVLVFILIIASITHASRHYLLRRISIVRVVAVLTLVIYALDTLIEEILDVGTFQRVLVLCVLCIPLIFIVARFANIPGFKGFKNERPAFSILQKENIAFIVAVAISISAFNPLLTIRSIGLVKASSNAVGISLSKQNFEELQNIRKSIDSYDPKTTIVLSNVLCADNQIVEVSPDLTSCDSRIFIVSGILGFRSPFEGWTFPIWSGNEEIERRLQLVSDYSRESRNYLSLRHWALHYSDPVIPSPEKILFLFDKEGNSQDQVIGPVIFDGKRFILSELTNESTVNS